LFNYNIKKETEQRLWEQWLVYYKTYISNRTTSPFITFEQFKNKNKKNDITWDKVEEISNNAFEKLQRKKGRKKWQ